MAYKRRLRFDKRIRFRKSMGIMYILLFVVLASVGVGYSYISSQLHINGTSQIIAASWDVHFDNLQVRSGSVTASTPASITDDTTVEFAVTLDEPNDFYEFTVDAVNNGTMDAMIDSFSISPTLNVNQMKYLEYTITYSDEVPLANKQELKAGESETIRVVFRYRENSNKENYSTTDQSFNISFSVTYTQADNTSNIVRTYLYRHNTKSVFIQAFIESDTKWCIINGNYNSCSNGIGFNTENECILYTGLYCTNCYCESGIITPPDLGTTYTTYQDVVSNTGYDYFLRHTISNNQIFQSSVGFVYNGNVYYIIGAGASLDKYGLANNDSHYYEQNKATLNQAFGSSNCTESLNVNALYYSCESSNINAYAYLNGNIQVQDNEFETYCGVYGDRSFCDLGGSSA